MPGCSGASHYLICHIHQMLFHSHGQLLSIPEPLLPPFNIVHPLDPKNMALPSLLSLDSIFNMILTLTIGMVVV